MIKDDDCRTRLRASLADIQRYRTAAFQTLSRDLDQVLRDRGRGRHELEVRFVVKQLVGLMGSAKRDKKLPLCQIIYTFVYSLIKGAGLEELLLQVLNAYCVVLTEHGQVERAWSYLKKAEAIARGCKCKPEDRVMLLQNEGVLLHLQGKYSHALRQFKKASLQLRRLRRGGTQDLLAFHKQLFVVVHNIAKTLRSQGSPQHKIYYEYARRLKDQHCGSVEIDPDFLSLELQMPFEQGLFELGQERRRESRSRGRSAEREGDLLWGRSFLHSDNREIEELLMRKSQFLEEHKQRMTLFVTTDLEESDVALQCRIDKFNGEARRDDEKKRKKIIKMIGAQLIEEIKQIKESEKKESEDVREIQTKQSSDYDLKVQQLARLEELVAARKEELFKKEVNERRKRIGKNDPFSIRKIKDYLRGGLEIARFSTKLGILRKFGECSAFMKFVALVRRLIKRKKRKSIFHQRLQFQGRSVFVMGEEGEPEGRVRIFSLDKPSIGEWTFSLDPVRFREVAEASNPMQLFVVSDDWQICPLRQFIAERPYINKIFFKFIYRLHRRKRHRRKGSYIETKTLGFEGGTLFVNRRKVDNLFLIELEEIELQPRRLRNRKLYHQSFQFFDPLTIDTFFLKYHYCNEDQRIVSKEEFLHKKRKKQKVVNRILAFAQRRRYLLMRGESLVRIRKEKAKLFSLFKHASGDMIFFYQLLFPVYKLYSQTCSQDKFNEIYRLFETCPALAQVVRVRGDLIRFSEDKHDDERIAQCSMLQSVAIVKIRACLNRYLIRKSLQKQIRKKYLIFKKYATVQKLEEDSETLFSSTSSFTDKEKASSREPAFFILWLENSGQDLAINRYRLGLERLMQRPFNIQTEVGEYEKDLLASSENPIDKIRVNLNRKSITVVREEADCKHPRLPSRLNTRLNSRTDLGRRLTPVRDKATYTRGFTVQGWQLEFVLNYVEKIGNCFFYIRDPKEENTLHSGIIDLENAMEIVKEDNLDSKFSFARTDCGQLEVTPRFEQRDSQAPKPELCRSMSGLLAERLEHPRLPTRSYKAFQRGRKNKFTTKRKLTIVEEEFEMNGVTLSLSYFCRKEGIEVKFLNCLPESKLFKRRTTLFALHKLTIKSDRIACINESTLLVPWWSSLTQRRAFWVCRRKCDFSPSNEYKLIFEQPVPGLPENHAVYIIFYKPRELQLFDRLKNTLRRRMLKVRRRVLVHYRLRVSEPVRQAVVLQRGRIFQSLVRFQDEEEEHNYVLPFLPALQDQSRLNWEAGIRFDPVLLSPDL